MKTVTLRSGHAVAELAPEVGGGVARLQLLGHEVLRRTPPEASRNDPLMLAEFPMAPWINRIANGGFEWRGRCIDVSEGPGGDPQGLHGIAWRTSWSVERADQAGALLGMAWQGGKGWPFPFEMTRQFQLSADRLAIEAALRNVGDKPMPAAMGFHPYFPSQDASLQAEVAGAWLNASDGIPRSWERIEEAERMCAGVAARELDLDHCFTGWSGKAVLTWPTHTVTLETDPPADFLQVYAPGGDYLCVEPQTSMPDAFNRSPAEAGQRILLPGEHLAMRLTVRVQSR